MSDLNITPLSSVQPTANTQIARGTAGGSTVKQGMSVYTDPTSNFSVKPAQATSGSGSAPAANLAGVALDQAEPGQPVTYAFAGDVTLTASPAMTVGQVYVIGLNNPGGIAPVSDLGTGNYVGVIGVATSATNLHLGLIPTAAQKP